MTRHELVCEGNTKAVREALKARKWRYDPSRQVWTMDLVDAHAQRIIDGDDYFFKGLGGHLKGCRLVLDGVVRWASKTYGQPATTVPAAAPIRNDAYACDASGNYVGGRRIPGSSPDDLI